MSGISQDQVKKYWDERSGRQRDRTVGPNNWSMDKQDQIYQERFKFIGPKIPRDKHIIDYGCGIGRYSLLFLKEKYLGLDICDNLLSIAKAKNPGFTYQLLSSPYPPELNFPAEIFFTATVLQHNDDNGLKKILMSAKGISKGNLTFCIYENTAKESGKRHICFRSKKQYLDFISLYFEITGCDSWSHILHKEEHSLMLVKTKRIKQ